MTSDARKARRAGLTAARRVVEAQSSKTLDDPRNMTPNDTSELWLRWWLTNQVKLAMLSRQNEWDDALRNINPMELVNRVCADIFSKNEKEKP